MSARCGKIVEIMETIAPPFLAQPWDNVGLLIGDMDSSVENVMVTLDITREVVTEAIKKNTQLIISHHPLIFKPLKNIVKGDPLGSLIHELIKHGISVYCSHTNLDSAENGTNEILAHHIGLRNVEPFIHIDTEQYSKLVVYVPEDHIEQVRDSICKAGAGHIGKYSDCTFSTAGQGTFRPHEGANPYLGQMNSMEKVSEYKLETIVPNEMLKSILSKMFQVHPYEEVAYDIIPLNNKYHRYGIARIGYLDKPKPLDIFCEELKRKLGLSRIKTTGNINKTIHKVALCAGSGSEYIRAAHRAGCDCFITGDVKYHDAQDAIGLGFTVIDAGHFETETLICEALKEKMNSIMDDNMLDVTVFASTTYLNPFQFF